MTPRQNAVLIALIAICAPLVTVALLSIDDLTLRIVIFSAYVALIAVVAGVFRLRFERMSRK